MNDSRDPFAPISATIDAHLRGLGLYVSLPDPEEIQMLETRRPGSWRFHVSIGMAKPARVPTNRFFGNENQPFEDRVARLIHLKDDPQWYFTVHDTIPGPGPEDFTQPYRTWEPILPVIEDFYFGHPTMIAGWPIPLHRMPPWRGQDAAITALIAQAVPMTAERFTAYRIQVREASWGSTHPLMATTPRPTTYLFTPVAHPTGGGTLFIRRDLGEAYLVSMQKS